MEGMTLTLTTNLDRLFDLSVRDFAVAICRYFENSCAYCPLESERKCRENCAFGFRAWLSAPYNPTSDIWKETRR